jgi:hypothetical protein
MKQERDCTLGLLLGPALAQGAIAQGALPAITEAEAHAIGVDAYLYFYPLNSADITRLTSTNIDAGKEPLKGPMNTFSTASSNSFIETTGILLTLTLPTSLPGLTRQFVRMRRG